MLGRVPDADLVEAYRAADVAGVVPSLSFEGFRIGRCSRRAACATPSIVSAVGCPAGVSRRVPLGPVAGREPADRAGLGARLQAAADGQLPSRAATTLRYAERFSWPALAARHRELYSRLAAGERDERPRVVYLDHVARLSGGEIALLRMLPHFQGVRRT